jgi:2-polyprenyl-6-methoxyphenol hydroxylase-like FAD-dependent oxidoreductase
VRVGVVGAGIGGLTLAHALRRSGVDCVVLERDASPEHTAGYRLHLTETAVAALATAAPAAIVAALRACGTGPESFRQFAVIDHRGRTRLRIPMYRDEDVLMIGRRPLRAVLARGLGDTVRWGTPVEGYTESADRVRVHLRDGTHTDVDVLVGADGVRSRVARGLLGGPGATPAGVIGIAGRTPLTSRTVRLVPPSLVRGPGFVIGPGGVGSFLSLHRPRPSDDPAAEQPYVVWSIAARTGQFDGDPAARSPGQLVAEALRLTRSWSPRMRALMAAADTDSTAAFPFWFPAALAAWPVGRVTVLGDAIHPMPPTAGAGASTAIIDAVHLARDLAGLPPEAALATYQARLLSYAPAAVDEARPPLAWQRRLANPVLRAVATEVVLPLAGLAVGMVHAARR